MLHAKVLATATATLKHPSLNGKRLLLVQAYGPNGKAAAGDPVLVVDTQGAAVGVDVVITSDGSAARDMTGDATTPVRWTVVGICDA